MAPRFDLIKIPADAFDDAIRSAYYANDAHEEMVRTPHWVDYRRHWRIFLESADDVFTKLQAGAQTHPTSLQAWSQVKKARASDPLMKWMHEARNVAKHDVQKTIEWGQGSLTVRAIEGDRLKISTTRPIGMFGPREGKTDFDLSGTAPERYTIVPAVPKMLTIQDRYRKVYPPPTMHLGKPYTSTNPNDAANDCLAYLQRLIISLSPHVHTAANKPS